MNEVDWKKLVKFENETKKAAWYQVLDITRCVYELYVFHLSNLNKFGAKK